MQHKHAHQVQPIKQKKRHFGPKKEEVIKKEVDELLKAGHIREVKFPTWLSNVVLVPKSSGATYQRLMDKVFSKQIGRNVDVYFDDILVKSQDDLGLVIDLGETFATLRSYGVKLNPEKCAFGVRGAKKFEWDDECGKAFEELKNYLIELSVLAKAIPTRKLRPYFLSHPIVVLTNSLIGRILTHADISGRLVKWTTELRSGVGVLLVSPRGDEIREKNDKADSLAKMAISLYSWKTKEVVVQVELTPSTEIPPLAQEENDWRRELLSYMEKGELPKDPKKAYRLKQRSLRFVMVEGVIYKRSFSGLLLKCLGPEESNYVLREIHEGCCGNHLGSYVLARKVLLAGYFWPTILKDVLALVTSCDSCQRHSRLQHQPTTVMKGIVAACPFDQWRIDIVGHFPPAPIQKKFLLVAIDYFSKWVDVEALARITEGEVEVTNRSLVQSLKTRLGKVQGNWVDELPSVLWSYRTTPRIGTGETPFSLVYRNEAVLPAEIGEESARVIFYDEKNGEKRLEDLYFVEERREVAAIRMEEYKNMIARSYNCRVCRKGFQVGYLVLRRVQEVAVGKLGPKWGGPFKVVERLKSDTYYLEDSKGKRNINLSTSHHLSHAALAPDFGSAHHLSHAALDPDLGSSHNLSHAALALDFGSAHHLGHVDLAPNFGSAHHLGHAALALDFGSAHHIK
ncbi:uncharacterized protein [Henckelia pumila]|uniref:uncharacterized protein n=1 Tax=Henckelia pumila TaxID=405737 RepID=UPI003C6EA3EB